MSLKVGLLDDHDSQADSWLAAMQAVSPESGFEFVKVSAGDFTAGIEVLAKHRQQILRDKPAETANAPATLFDEYDILVVDYDLTFFDEGVFHTGEQVAYLARTFSQCGLIVLMNQFKVDFDLSLRGHPESYADLNIPSSLIGSESLWSESPSSSFRPWNVPSLGGAAARFQTRVDQLESSLDRPILDFLGLGGDFHNIPLSVLSFLSVEGVEPQSVTFRDFVNGSQHGARIDGVNLGKQAARVAASRIGVWVEQMLMPLQDVLVDAPHLLSREGWPVGPDHDVHGLPTEVRQALTECEFELEGWTSGRRCWRWSCAVQKMAVMEAPEVDGADFVFCEDVSRFAPFDAARSFLCDLPTPYTRRFVVDPSSDSQYLSRELVDSLTSVRYLPAVRFAL